jgi:hypothetical protein
MEITFTRTSERTLTWVEPNEGFTIEQIVKALNKGEARLTSDSFEGYIERNSDKAIMGTYAECQSTAAGDVDEDFVAR